jgi:selenocysteine lyase/cysteine desulfurase
VLSRIEPDEVGGGMVDDVSFQDYTVTERLPEREEAGTPNIVGAVLLGAALETLMQVGMEAVRTHEQGLLGPLLDALAKRPRVRVYGDTDLARSPRVATVAFNLVSLDHALVAAVLNDYFGVAVRNACFCAHPYVREMLKPELWETGEEIDVESADGLMALELRKGMVRASFGLYTVREDLDALLAGIDSLLADPEGYRARYECVEEGLYRHRDFAVPARALFDPGKELLSRIGAAGP